MRAVEGLLTTLVLVPMLAGAAELKVGDRAPEFALPDQDGRVVKLSDFRGKKNVALAFYVLAFTGG
jgi:peroxiredoxin Q/BCP